MIHDNRNYEYQFSLRQGGITTHLYCSDAHFLSDLNALSIKNTSDLQGIQIFHKSDEFDILVEERAQMVLLANVSDALYPSITQIDHRKFCLKGDLKQRGFINQLPHILYSVSESSRQLLNSQCTIHAAGIFRAASGGSILILGDKGSGKTSTALALCLDHGSELIGNDLVILGNNIYGNNLYLHGGTTSFTFRKNVINTYFPNIDLEEALSSATHLVNIDYEDKITLSPECLGISICNELQKIILTVRVNVHQLATCNSSSDLFQKKIEALRLHENFARHIRGQTTPLMLNADGKIFGYFPSFDSHLAQEVRNDIISLLLDMPFYHITAQSPQECALQIINLIE